jgi:hypothetical protein
MGKVVRLDGELAEQDHFCLICLLKASIIIRLFAFLIIYALIAALLIKLLKTNIDVGYEEKEEHVREIQQRLGTSGHVSGRHCDGDGLADE